MKNLILILVSCLMILSCDKDDDNACTGIDCLPPITQTGAGTFGFLVNGEPYIDNSGNFNCFYQNINGTKIFNISPQFNNKYFSELDFGSSSIDFLTINSFEIKNDNSENIGGASLTFSNEFRQINTNENYGGICIITNFDTTNNIISGTFEFQIFDEQTQTLYQVTDGRFDSTFTR